ncbi:MAG: radical SAM protein [Flavobacteriales bacterium]|nr:radical SAM protein [Flavobacteriales bacterium]
MKILLVTPPFVQINTPYPATCFIKGFLNTLGIESKQIDLSLEVNLRIFSKKGLTEVFETINTQNLSETASRMYALKYRYITLIDDVILFLQNQKPSLAQQILQPDYLPVGSKIEQAQDLEWAFGKMGNSDKAKHLATLFLEDLIDFIQENLDKNYGMSKYAEKLAASTPYFDDLYNELCSPNHLISTYIQENITAHCQEYMPDVVAFTLPFPGNVFGALKAAQAVKNDFPNIKIIAGGGYANTELRSINDPRFFEFIDFLTLDSGELPMKCLIEFFENKRTKTDLKRTFYLHENKVAYFNNAELDIPQRETGTPSYLDLPLNNYVSLIEMANPMNRMWNEMRWNKLMLAHGCYWGKCTFCDVSLDYIKRYEPLTAANICNRIEKIISETNSTAFHFVDEAAPPALMRDLAIELLNRNLQIQWWANIRFEKKFTPDLCKLLAKSGCIAVSGGLEVANDRILNLIKKGVSIEQTAQVCHSFSENGIMVHAYLMYGFPTQTELETINSLEIVRQLFEHNLIKSAFWHQFSMTMHSPVGLNPTHFGAENLTKQKGSFANNDLEHTDGLNHEKYARGLQKATYNFMYEVGFEQPVHQWFSFKIVRSNVLPNTIESYIEGKQFAQAITSSRIIYLGEIPSITPFGLRFETTSESIEIELPNEDAKIVRALLSKTHYKQSPKTVNDLDKIIPHLDFWLHNTDGAWLRDLGIVVV